jgi:CTP:molybdopterin cytidylyltransferase MocA
MKLAGVLLGGGASRRFGVQKLEAELDGRRLVDLACEHFLEAGLDPVVFVGRVQPSDPRVVVAEPGDEMIDTLRSGLGRIPAGAFAFAPADMPALSPELVRALIEAFERCGQPFLVPSFGGRRGHPAFAREREPFMRLGDRGGAREIWREAGDRLHHEVVETADVLFDIDTADDFAAAGSAASRLDRLIARGDLPDASRG